MAFKMKGSSYKMGGHKTKATMAYMKNMKSPLEQKVDHASIHGDAEDKKYDLLSEGGDYDFAGGSLPSANVVTHKKGNYLKGKLNEQFADRPKK